MQNSSKSAKVKLCKACRRTYELEATKCESCGGRLSTVPRK